MITFRKLKLIDHDVFAQDIVDADLILNPESNLENLVNQYNMVFSDLLEKHAPLRKRIITDRPCNPWYNDEIKEAKQYLSQAAWETLAEHMSHCRQEMFPRTETEGDQIN